ncbi:MAG: CoA transferase [Dehalococcoidia bacterium]|jgi:crotonobetainyl-CoA:carnitine CoA-transferase CaiB-like acyl-CoA transferase
METAKNKALNDLRVLDLAGSGGVYCTKLLADLGADVIKIEPPGGDSMRQIGPFYHDEIHPEKSLYFWHFNTSKKSITLNLNMADGREIFKKLVKKADIIVETFQPGYLGSLGLAYEDLKKINPGIILVSITGFGQTGPYRDFKSADLIGLAMSGVLYTTGFPEDPPTSLGGNQAYHMVSSNAAIGALMAVFYRDVTGEGQWVDIPMQGTNIRMSEMVPFTYWVSGKSRYRSGLEYYRARKDIFSCKDGRVVCGALGGAGAEKMLEWMESEGMVADLRDEKYAPVVGIIMGSMPLGKGSQQKVHLEAAKGLRDYPQEADHIDEVWETFLKTHTREELFVGAQTRGIRLMPVNDAKSVVEDIGLKERGYFVDVEHPELNQAFKYPGAPYRLSETPWKLSKRAPLIGENNIEIYKDELGLSDGQLAGFKADNVI